VVTKTWTLLSEVEGPKAAPAVKADPTMRSAIPRSKAMVPLKCLKVWFSFCSVFIVLVVTFPAGRVNPSAKNGCSTP